MKHNISKRRTVSSFGVERLPRRGLRASLRGGKAGRVSCLVLLALACALPLLPVQAGGGPENTLVVVNPTAEGSMEIANLFQQLRGIPEKNMYYLPASSVNWGNGVNQSVNVSMSSDDFRSRILLNVMNYIKQQGLTNQIDYIVYSSDFPTQISPSADDPNCSWNPSLTTATIFADYVQTAGTMSIAANNYVNRYRGATLNNSWYSWPAYTGDTTTTNLNHKTSWGGQNYYISAILGWTGYHGNTVGEITNMLVRSAQADGTFPSGSVYMDVNSDIRSTTRQPEFVPAQTELQSLGRSAIIISNAWNLVNQTNVVGGVLGYATTVIPSGSTFAKGSIVDSLTSNAATWNDIAQTKCTRWIAVGVSGTSGQVEEPYAYWQKFPTARMHAHYARGCTMGETQSQSIWWPTDGLILGDPLCRPFAIIPSVSLSGLTEGQTVSGTNVTLTPSATTTSPSGIAGYDLYLDGVLWQSVAFGGNTSLDTTKISDGSHELRVVAYENSVIRTQGNLAVNFQVNNAGQAITVTPSSLTTAWNNGTFSLTAAAVGGNPASINILKGQKVVGTISGSSGTAVMNQSDVGVGASILRASAVMSSGTVQSVKVPVLLQPAANLTPPAVINWTTTPYAGLYNLTQINAGNYPTYSWQFNKPMGIATNVQVLAKYKYGYENPLIAGYYATAAPYSTNWYQFSGLSSNTWNKEISFYFFPSYSPEGVLSGNMPVIISGTDDNGTAFSYTNDYPNVDLTPPQFSAVSLTTNFVQAGQTATIRFTSSKLLMATNSATPATVTNLVAVGANLATFVSSNGLNYVYNYTPTASTPVGSNAVVISAADLFGNSTDTAITSDDFENKTVGWLVSSNDSRWISGWDTQPYVTNDVAAAGSKKSAFFPAQNAPDGWQTVKIAMTIPGHPVGWAEFNPMPRQPTGWAEFDIYPDNTSVSGLANRGFTVAGIGGPGFTDDQHTWGEYGDHEVGLVFAQDAAAVSNGTCNLVMDLPAAEVFQWSSAGLLYGTTNGASSVPYSSTVGAVTLASGITTKAWHHVRFGNDLRAHTYTVELDGTLYADHVPYNPLTNGEYEAKSYYYNYDGGVGTNGVYNINSICGYLFTAVGDNYHVDNVKISGGDPTGVGGYPPLSIFVGNPPVANSQSVTMLVNRSQAITLTTNDPDSLTYSVGSPAHGTLSGTAPNLTYTPNANYNGADSFTFTATDTVDGLTSNVATVSITVNAPTANNQSVNTDKNTAQAITLTTNDTNPVTYTVTSPTNGTLSGTAPNLTYTPNTGYTGADSFTFYVTDGTVNSNVATVSITVNPPPVANNGSLTTDANTAWDQIILSATGGSGLLTYHVTNPAHGTIYNYGGSYTWYTPNTGYTGPDSFTFYVTDGAGGASNTATVSVTVNADPVANNQSVTTDQNTAKAVTLTATGGTGSLTYSVVANPTHGTLSGTAPNLTYTPSTGYTGSDSFTFNATDGIKTSNTATVSLTVNASPVANNQSATTDQNIAKAVTLTATGGSGPLTYSVVANPTHGTLSGTAPNLTYTPNTGYTGSDSFTFNATDGIATSNTAMVLLTVNASPVTNNQSATTDQNIAKAVTLTATGGSGPLTYSVVANPTNGTLSGTAPNLTYTPNAGYTGTDSFTFNATDGIATSNTATVSLTVNASPVANNQSVTTNLNVAKAVTLTATGGSGPLTYNVVANPTNGTLSGTAPNLVYTPNTGYSGADSFTFNATDGIATSNTATVSLTVNASPVANNQSATTDQNAAKAVTLTATGGSGPLTYSVVANPTHGTLSGTAPNLTYTPNTGYTGSDSFTFKATDGIATSNTATVSLTVTKVELAPVAQSQSVNVTENTATTVTLTASDADGDPVTYSVVTSPSHGLLSGTTPNLTYTPVGSYLGSDSFTFKANDGVLDSNAATVTLTVSAAPVTSAASSSSSGSSGTNSVASASPSYVYGTSPASYGGAGAGQLGTGNGEWGTPSLDGGGTSTGSGSPGTQDSQLGTRNSQLGPQQAAGPSPTGYFGSPLNPVSFPMPMPVPPPTVYHEPEPTLIRRSTFDVRHPMQKERTEPSSSDVEHRTPASPRLGEGGSNIEHRTSNVECGGAALPVQVGVAALFTLGSLAATLVSSGRKIKNFLAHLMKGFG